MLVLPMFTNQVSCDSIRFTPHSTKADDFQLVVVLHTPSNFIRIDLTVSCTLVLELTNCLALQVHRN